MKKRSKRPRGGPTISQAERASRGYGNVLFSLPEAVSIMIGVIAVKLGDGLPRPPSRSAVVQRAVVELYMRLVGTGAPPLDAAVRAKIEREARR